MSVGDRALLWEVERQLGEVEIDDECLKELPARIFRAILFRDQKVLKHVAIIIGFNKLHYNLLNKTPSCPAPGLASSCSDVTACLRFCQ